MHVALVHELLTMRGGAERVLKVLAEMFPEAPIYTLLYDERKLGSWFPKSRVRVSRAQGAPWASMNHHRHLAEFPDAVEAWDFSEFDLVISSSSAFVHGIITNSAPKHLCYVHSPARYLWDRTHDVMERAGKGPLGWLKTMYLSRLFHKLRGWDAEVADRADALLAASSEVQRRIELYWRRESKVVHPPVDDFWFESPVPSSQSRVPYLIVSQLVPYKRIDLAIRACNERRVPLTVVGEGPARGALEKLAGSTVTFVGYKKEDELRDLYRSAKAVLFPGEEDFGLVPLESLACGTPVIAFRGGGALETLTEKTAEFFDEATPAAMITAMERFEKRSFRAEDCRARAKEFSREHFEREIRSAIDLLCSR